MTTVVGAPRSGKTALAHAIISRTPAHSRRCLVEARMYRDVRTAFASARDQLGRDTVRGDVIIIDGLDELPQTSPEETLYATRQPWLQEARPILTTRPHRGALLSARSTLSIGPVPTIHEDDGTPYWGELFRLSWSQSDLYEALVKLVGAPAAQQALGDLYLSDFFNAPDGGASKLAALQRLLVANDARSGPSVVLTIDGTGRLQVLPASTLPEMTVRLEEVESAFQSRLILPYKASRNLWIPRADELEELINDPNVLESDIQAFFEANPHLLSGADYSRLEPHPYLERIDGGPLVPDFMLEPTTGGFADLLDLKRPNSKLVVEKRNRLRQAAHLTEAIAQMREYRAWFDEPDHRAAFQKKYNMTAYRPAMIVVIGRTPTSDLTP